MKKLMSLILILAMVLSLAACGSKADAPAVQESAEPVELEFIQWWGTENGGDYLDDLIARFEAENPGIKI